MTTFELKLNFSGLEIELKGDVDSVLEMYDKIKEDFLLRTFENNDKSLTKNIDDVSIQEQPENTKTISKKTTKPNGTKKTSKPQKTELHEKFNESDFYETFTKLKPKTSKNRILIAMKLYLDQTDLNLFNESIIHTLLSKAAVDTPTTLRAQLSHFVNRDKILERVEEGYSFTFSGKRKIETLISNLEKNVSEK